MQRPPAMRRVLLVDADAAMIRMLAEGLAEAGWQSSTATRARDALALLRARGFAALVSDVRMGDGNGFDLLRRVRSEPDPPPVILTSAFGREGEALQAFALGAYGYLSKPFDLGDLLALLERVHSRPLPAEARP